MEKGPEGSIQPQRCPTTVGSSLRISHPDSRKLHWCVMGAYRPHEINAEADRTLAEYHRGLREADLRGQLDADSATAPVPEGSHRARLRNIAIVWLLVVLACSVAGLWFLDRVVTAELLAVVTAFVSAFTLSRRPRTESIRDASANSDS